LQPVNHGVLASLHPEQVEVEIWRADELEVRRGLSSELDEMWSYVFKKANPRWLWHAIDHHTGKVWFDLNHGGFPPDNMARLPSLRFQAM
jgi:hypothetical protein